MSGPSRKGALAAAALALAACQQAPVLGPPAGAPPPTGPRIVLSSASVDAARRVVVTFEATRDGRALGLEAARALAPEFTLAALGEEPVSGLPAWRSLILTGPETLPRLPVAGPGTPEGQVLVDARQPGGEREGSWSEAGGGVFTYTFATPLPDGQALSDTLRVGAFLTGVPGSRLTTSTLDFVPDRSPLTGRELVVEAACEGCHGLVRAHDGSRTGVRICVTCHTYQHADGQTVDPAAPAAASAAESPNPLELGRLVHRIHRGKNLPTFYAASSAAAATLPPGSKTAQPFLPGRNKLPVSPATGQPDAAHVGRRFAVVGEHAHERVWARIASRAENAQPARLVVEGATFPRDLRACDACHTEAAAQVAALDTEISRRTCHGCHPDVWFQDAVAPEVEARPPDVFHLAHPGGPQADDARCAECHVRRTGQPEPLVPMTEAHVPPYRHPRYSPLTVRIESVTNLRPGLAPTVVFSVSDRNGPLLDLDSPSPATDATSPVPRALSRLTINLAGPAEPDIRSLGTATLPYTETVPLDIASADGKFSFTFPETKKIPEGAEGTWLVVIEARRAVATTLWDGVAGRFGWPYTGETVTETADNAVAWVDAAAGELGFGEPAPRRQVVDEEKCHACHERLRFHGGGSRNRVEWCLACHVADKTDWTRRPKTLAGDTDLARTPDAVEERSVHFKLLVHRLHTGGRVGPASLTGILPFVIYGYSGAPSFHDAGGFPGDLSRCTVCHLEGTYRVEAIPVDAAPTQANETPTVRHSATTAHAADEPSIPPVAAACRGCHATAYAEFHAARYTSGGKEQCLSCHGVSGAQAVDKVHGLPQAVAQ